MQEIEIEEKNRLDRVAYDRLSAGLFSDSPVVTQVNHYFETPNLKLRDQGIALRIRKKNDQYVATLKEPTGEGLLESHTSLSEQEAFAWFENDVKLSRLLQERLQTHNIQGCDLKYYGKLTTYRQTLKMGEFELALDRSVYHDIEDYELEIEGPTREKTVDKMNDILKAYEIPKQPIDSKIKRFFYQLPGHNI